MSDPIYVSNFGVHRTPQGLVYLHQANDRAFNFVGLAEKSPFEVVLYGRSKVCPHRIEANAPMPDNVHWRIFLHIIHDQMGGKFLPIPRHPHDKIPFISNKINEQIILALSTMCSPLHPVVHRFDMMKIEEFEDQMQLTNVAPLVLTDWTFEKQSLLESYCTIARRSPRRFIAVGDPKIVMRAGLERVSTNLDTINESVFYSLPFENLGAVILRRWARGEQIDGPWVR